MSQRRETYVCSLSTWETWQSLVRGGGRCFWQSCIIMKMQAYLWDLVCKLELPSSVSASYLLLLLASPLTSHLCWSSVINHCHKHLLYILYIIQLSVFGPCFQQSKKLYNFHTSKRAEIYCSVAALRLWLNISAFSGFLLIASALIGDGGIITNIA